MVLFGVRTTVGLLFCLSGLHWVGLALILWKISNQLEEYFE